MKNRLLDLAKEKVQIRLDEATKAMEAAQSAANEDTKSSAGDKFETSRAMAHNDYNLYKRQWHEAMNDWQLLEIINPENSNTLVSNGSLVKTDIGIFFFCISAGIVQMDNQKVMVASLTSPIGEALKGKKTGEKFEFREKQIGISEVS
jgi:transcription elongation GreA/GreB family factor